jgi:chromosome segregation ATPase
MTKAELAAIKARLAGASKAPWRYNAVVGRFENGDQHSILRIYRTGKGRVLEANRPDQAFITSARQDVPRLVDEVERLNANIGELKQIIAREEQGAALLALQDEIAQVDERINALQNSIGKLEQENSRLARKEKRYPKRIDQKTEEINHLEKVVAAARALLQKKNRKSEELLEAAIELLCKFRAANNEDD